MRLNQITIPSLDVVAAIPFYQTLGLQLIVHTHDDYARFVVPDGQATFSIHRVDKLPDADGAYIYFECDNLDEKVAFLQAKGVAFEMLPTDQTWLWREAHLRDPDGNKIILYLAGENRINPPWKLQDSE